MTYKRVIPFAVPLLLSALVSSQVFASDMYGEIVTDDITYGYKDIQVHKPAIPDDGGYTTGMWISSSTHSPVTVQIDDTLKINVTDGTSQGQATGFSSGDDITITGKNMEVSATGQATSSVVHGMYVLNSHNPSSPSYANILVENLSVKANAPNTEARGIELGRDMLIEMQGKTLDVQATGDHAIGIFNWSSTGDANRTANLKYDTINVTAGGSGRNGSWYAFNGIWADDSIFNIDAKTTTVSVNETGTTDAHALVANGTQGAINITGDTNISAVKGDGLTYAARVWNGAKIKMGDYGVDDGATRVIKGNIASQSSGDITLSLTNSASSLTGRVYDSDGTTHLTVTNGATWNMAGNSGVTNLYTGNNAVIDLTYVPDSFQTLKVGTLDAAGTGGSLFKLKTDIEADASDTVKITNGTGTNRILVHSVGLEPQRERMNTYLAEVANGDASFVLENRARLVDAGTYVYDLHNETNANTGVGTGWYLQRTERDILSPTAEAVVTLTGIASSYSMWHSQLGDLRKRMGEIRFDTAQDGFWFRTFGQKDKLDGLEDTRFSQDVYGASAGFDRLFRQDANNEWLFGVKGQYTKADQDLHGKWGGSGKNENFGVAAYATWKHTDGWYADAVLSWDRYHQKISDHMLDGTKVSGSYNRYGLGASIEGGRNFKLANDVFIEPQVQLSYFWLKGKGFTMDNGLEVDTKNADVVTGRAGLVLGKKWEISKSRYVQPYLKGGVIHEFTGDDKTTINYDNVFKGDISGTRPYYGLGIDWKFNEQARLYGEFERQDGDHVRSLWNVNVGLRVSF